MIKKKKLIVYVIVSAVLGITTAGCVSGEGITDKKKNSMSPKALEIQAQIERIEEILESDPKPEGWVLIGDANMALKKFDAAVHAYSTAYELSGRSLDVRRKLRQALYYAQTRSLDSEE